VAILLSDEEMNVLHEQHHFYFKLYVHALRRFMDYNTGIVGGKKRRISYQSIREEMYIVPRRGVSRSDTGSQTKSEIRRALKHLERIGLIEKISPKNDDHLVFKCCLAIIGNPRPKLSRHISDTQPDTQAVTKKTSANLYVARVSSDSELKADTQADIPFFDKPAHLSISDKDKEKEILRISKKKAKTQLSDDFQVTSQHEVLAQKNAWPNPHSEIDAFKDYHIARATSFSDWDRAFYTWLRNAKKFQGENHANKQSKDVFKSNSMSRALDNILNSPSRAKTH
jgi:hypothetical protein